jgi:sugar/nucleoside kinase (ribokinase family)
MMKEFDILAVGELNADLILRGDVTPEFGQVEKFIESADLTPGSSTGIFACGAAQLGLRVAFIGKVGDDEFGHFLLRELERRGIDISGAVIDPYLKTGLTVILSRGADRAILTFPGCIPALRYEEIDLSYVARARHLHIGSYFLLDALRPNLPTLFDLAHTHTLTVSMDTNYDPSETWDDGLWECLERTDIFLPNEAELRAIFQAIARNEGTLETSLHFFAQHVPTVAAKLGAQGAIAQRGKEVTRANALSLEVVDTTGAGDTFDAGFIYGHLAGWDLKRALRFACVCGSLSTRAAGGTTAQPSPEEVLSFM